MTRLVSRSMSCCQLTTSLRLYLHWAQSLALATFGANAKELANSGVRTELRRTFRIAVVSAGDNSVVGAFMAGGCNPLQMSQRGVESVDMFLSNVFDSKI